MSATRGPQDLDSQLHAMLEPVVRDAGLLLEAVVVSGPERRRLVRVTVDLPDGPGGVSSDQLGEVSRAVSSALDGVEDRFPGTYLLEVSTPGTDRPLTTARHFRRAQGRLVTIVTADGEVVGRVTGVEGDQLHLDRPSAAGGATPASVPLGAVVSGRVEVELSRVTDAPTES